MPCLQIMIPRRIRFSDWLLRGQLYSLYEFTSGSTGVPKAVVVAQSSVVNLLNWINNYLHSTSGRIMQLASICFDVCIWELFSPFIVGNQSILPSPDVKITAFSVKTLLLQEVTAFACVPTLLSVFLEETQEEIFVNTSFYDVIVAGEAALSIVRKVHSSI